MGVIYITHRLEELRDAGVRGAQVAQRDTPVQRVYIDGKMVRDMKGSNGRGGYTTGANGQSIHFWTQEGPHVVLSKEATHTMSSASYGLSDPSLRDRNK